MGSFSQYDFSGRNTVVAGRIEYSGEYIGSRTVQVTLKMYGARVDDGSVASNATYSASTTSPYSWTEDYSLTTGTTAAIFKNKVELHLITRTFTVSVNDSGVASVNMNFGITATSSSSYTVTLNVTSLQFDAPPYTSRTLYITADTGASVTVSRTSSPKGGGSIGQLYNYSTIYDEDVLRITYGSTTGYYVTNATVNGSVVTSGDTITVSSDVQVSVAAALHYWAWSLEASKSITVTANRISTNAGVSTGVLEEGAYVYYGDKVTITYTVNAGYEVDSSTVNGDAFASGDTIEVISGLNIVVIAGALGLVYIAGEAYQVYIGNGSGWDMFAPYVGEGVGVGFSLCS